MHNLYAIGDKRVLLVILDQMETFDVVLTKPVLGQ